MSTPRLWLGISNREWLINSNTPHRNAALHDLTKEIDPASLADLLGYSTQVMNIHAARAAVPMATYPALKQPTR